MTAPVASPSRWRRTRYCACVLLGIVLAPIMLGLLFARLSGENRR